MELTIQVPDAIRIEAAAQGMAPETLAERIVREDLERAAGMTTSFASLRKTAEELRALRKGHKLDGLSIKDLVNEGRKF